MFSDTGYSERDTLKVEGHMVEVATRIWLDGAEARRTINARPLRRLTSSPLLLYCAAYCSIPCRSVGVLQARAKGLIKNARGVSLQLENALNAGGLFRKQKHDLHRSLLPSSHNCAFSSVLQTLFGTFDALSSARCVHTRLEHPQAYPLEFVKRDCR